MHLQPPEATLNLCEVNGSRRMNAQDTQETMLPGNAQNFAIRFAECTPT